MLVELYKQGRFDLDAFVSERIGLGDIEAAFEKMHARRGAAIGGRAVSADAWPTVTPSPGGVRIDHTTTEGTFSLDGGTWEVENNVWVIGDDTQCVVIDAPHDAGPILELVGDRRLTHVLLTHAHDDHVTVVPELLAAHPGRRSRSTPTTACCGTRATPTSPRPTTSPTATSCRSATSSSSCCTPRGTRPAPAASTPRDLGVVFTGDTLFQGGPGATGRSYSDFPTIVESIRDQLLSLPPETVVLTGHGGATTIGDEKPDVEEWIRRGH